MDPLEHKSSPNTASRVFKYLAVRGITLAIMVSIGIFLAIVIINYGGYIDNIHRADIEESLNFISLNMPGASIDEVKQATEQARWAMEEAYGLHQPFLLRSIKWWYQTMTFDWGQSYQPGATGFNTGNLTDIRLIILNRLPYTLMLAGATNFLLFFASMFAALRLAQKNGSFMDRLAVTLSPLSAIPNWVYGIILTVIFAGELHLLPFNGMFDTFPPATKIGYVPIVLRHMILPVTAIFLGMFFSTLYTWRTYFLIHSGEDYMDLAVAKGVPTKTLNRRYMLKPTLPYVITSFVILMITFWQGIIVLEVFFDWPGLGQLFMSSITRKDVQVTIGIVTVFAFLLAFSIFLLDIIYVLVDPRVKISGDSQAVKPAVSKKKDVRFFTSAIFIWFSNNVWRRLTLQKKQHSLPGQRYLAAPKYVALYKRGSHRPYFARVIPSGEVAAQLSCPYLKLDNNHGRALQAPPHRCRCYVHDQPERIAAVYQDKFCRAQAYRDCRRLEAALPDRHKDENKASSHGRLRGVPPGRGGLYSSLGELLHYPLAVAGMLIIVCLIGVSIYAVIAIPYKEAIASWAPQTEEKYLVPKNALPTWVNLFRKQSLPATINLNSAKGDAVKVVTPASNGISTETITYTIDYQFGEFPKDMLIIFNGQYVKKPFVVLTWITPDGREFKLGNFAAVTTQRYLASEDIPQKYLTGQAVQQRGALLETGGGPSVVQVLFKDPAIEEMNIPIKGKYILRMDTTLFEENSNLDSEVILYGQVYGLAGTDDLRRDLMVPLLWGTPVALAFGVFGALATGILAMIIAALGVWYGGWLDNIIQRITEINMILPTLPIAITIYYLYSKSIWIILGVIIILSIFGSALKTYRAAFLQVKEAGYIEAARAYGASDWRIIWHYLVPRILPLLIPQLVILVPTYVFFEATLAYLNVSDPYLPTWGKVIYDALTRGAYQGYYYWVLEPVVMMIITALAFAVVGFALDSILNPKLRRI